MSDAAPIPSGVEIAPGRRVPEDALRFDYSSSSGPGGQNVNKKATKCRLRVWLNDLPMNPDARARLAEAYPWLLTSDGEVVIESGEHRSQGRNRDECLDRLREAVVRSLTPPKKRKPTRPSKGSKERRLREKQVRSGIKKNRRGEE